MNEETIKGIKELWKRRQNESEYWFRKRMRELYDFSATEITMFILGVELEEEGGN